MRPIVSPNEAAGLLLGGSEPAAPRGAVLGSGWAPAESRPPVPGWRPRCRRAASLGTSGEVVRGPSTILDARGGVRGLQGILESRCCRPSAPPEPEPGRPHSLQCILLSLPLLEAGLFFFFFFRLCPMTCPRSHNLFETHEPRTQVFTPHPFPAAGHSA